MNYKTDQFEISCEDNMKLMARYPDNYFELAVVDPPYGIDLANMNMGLGKSKKASKAKNRKWKVKDWDKYSPTEEFFNQLNRVSKNRIIWGGNYFDMPPCKHYIIWDKEIPQGLTFADCEYAYTTFNKAPVIFRYSAYRDKASKFHPTQKPVKLYEWIFKNYAKPGDKILDSHLGSGSIAIALDRMNKIEGMNLTLVACELDEDYYKAAIKRIKNQTIQTTIPL